MKKFLSATLVLLFSCITFSTSQADTIPDEQWSLNTAPGTHGGEELQGIEIQDNGSYVNQASYLVAQKDAANFDRENYLCSSTTDGVCSNAANIGFSAVLPACSESIVSDCVSALNAISTSGNLTQGKFVRNFPDRGNASFTGNALYGLPNGGSPSLWQIPGVNNGGGTDNYIVNFHTVGGKSGNIYNISRFDAFISPVKVVSGNYSPIRVEDSSLTGPTCVNSCGIRISLTSNADVKPCASVEQGSCALKQAFPSGFKFQLVVKLSNSPTGWFHGRLKSPSVSISKDQNGYLISMTAEPVVVPEVGILVKYADLPNDLKTVYAIPHSYQWGGLGPNGRGNALDQEEPNTSTAFERYALWARFFNDKASASPSLWTFRSLETNPETSHCFLDASQFQGVVTTNAMIYAGGPPVFDANTGTLDYKVGSPHFTSKNEIFKGTYDLQIRSDIARCLYKFTDAPIKAKISITNADGSSGVETTSVMESDGWLKMAAYGFTFSNPTISVKLTQENVPAPIQTPNPLPKTPITSEVKKKSILCYKGVIKKRVVAINPTCPKGYSRK